MGAMMGGGMTGAGMAGAMGLWVLVWLVAALVVLGVLIAAGVWVVRRTAPFQLRPAEPATDPTHILRRRYAAGEIDDNEYQRRLSTLSR